MRQRKPAATRRREIADAALDIIADRGLPGFTSVAVARRVGLSDGALFRHFPTKRAIVGAVIERVEEELAAGQDADGGDAIERLGAFFLQRAGVFAARPGVGRLVHSDDLARAASPAGVARVAAIRKRSQAFVRGCIDEAAREGLLADGLAPADAAALVFGAMSVLSRQSGGHADGAHPTAQGVWRALERTFRRAPLPPGGKIR